MSKTSTVKINWEELVKTTGRGYPESALNYPEFVEVSSCNSDGTITVITGQNDFGTPLVVRVDPLSEFVVEMVSKTANKPHRANVLENHQSKLETAVADTNHDLDEYTEKMSIPDFFPCGIYHQFDELMGKSENAKYELRLWNES